MDQVSTASHNKSLQRCSEQIALEGQDLPRTYLARHELESVIFIIIVMDQYGSPMLVCFEQYAFWYTTKGPRRGCHFRQSRYRLQPKQLRTTFQLLVTSNELS